MPVQPETQYAGSGEVHIAYQVVGEGELDLVWIPSLAHHVELSWENPPVARFLVRIAELGRLVVFDKRGTGMSDRVSSDTTLETRMDDIRAVMDAAGSERAVVCALGEGGPLAMLFAATYPERTEGLVLINSSPRLVRSAEFPWLPSRGEQEQNIEKMVREWGSPAQRGMLAIGNPDMAEDERIAFARALRLSVSPGAVRDYMRMNLDVDVRGVLGSIRVPTLVLHRTELVRLDIRGARYLAERIPSARLVELPGRNFAPAVGDADALFAEIERFCAEIRSGEWEELEPDRMLATVLFTDIVGSTQMMAELGDVRWRELLHQHHTAVRRQLGRFRAVEMDTAATGSSPASTGRRAGSAAPRPSRKPCVSSASKSAPAYIRASASSPRARSRASPSRSERGSPPRPSREKCSFRAPSGISSRARGSASRTVARTN